MNVYKIARLSLIRVFNFNMLRALVLTIFRRKLAAKLQETEEELSAALSKANNAEKAKTRLAAELEDANIDLEKVKFDMILKNISDSYNKML